MAIIDQLDAAILEVLQHDARTTNRDVAAAVGLSPTTALDRTRSLRERGVILGSGLDLDLEAIGRPVQALVAVRIRPPSRSAIEAFRDWLDTLPEVLGVFVTTGDHDFLVHVAVAGNDALYAFVIDRLTTRREVADVRTSVVYEYRRRKVIAPAGLTPSRPAVAARLRRGPHREGRPTPGGPSPA